MRLIRLTLAALAALSVVLTSASSAVARKETRVGTVITICIGHTVAVIEVDADGQPIQPLPICPDCVFGDVAILMDMAGPLRAAQAVRRVEPPLSQPLSCSDAARWGRQARAPPASA